MLTKRIIPCLDVKNGRVARLKTAPRPAAREETITTRGAR